MRQSVTSIVEVLGAVSVAFGASLERVSAGFIVGGLLAMLFCVRVAGS